MASVLPVTCSNEAAGAQVLTSTESKAIALRFKEAYCDQGDEEYDDADEGGPLPKLTDDPADLAPFIPADRAAVLTALRLTGVGVKYSCSALAGRLLARCPALLLHEPAHWQASAFPLLLSFRYWTFAGTWQAIATRVRENIHGRCRHRHPRNSTDETTAHSFIRCRTQ